MPRYPFEFHQADALTFPLEGFDALAREAMGIDWMTREELSQAIPPTYTEWLGARLLAVVR